MKLALLSDIHANIQAFEACLAHARAHGAQQFALLGDLVGYGADPVAVVAQAQALAAQGALLVKGNHDALAVRPPAVVQTVGDSTAAWTHAQLSAEQRSLLEETLDADLQAVSDEIEKLNSNDVPPVKAKAQPKRQPLPARTIGIAVG